MADELADRNAAELFQLADRLGADESVDQESLYAFMNRRLDELMVVENDAKTGMGHFVAVGKHTLTTTVPVQYVAEIFAGGVTEIFDPYKPGGKAGNQDRIELATKKGTNIKLCVQSALFKFAAGVAFPKGKLVSFTGKEIVESDAVFDETVVQHVMNYDLLLIKVRDECNRLIELKVMEKARTCTRGRSSATGPCSSRCCRPWSSWSCCMSKSSTPPWSCRSPPPRRRRWTTSRTTSRAGRAPRSSV